MFLAFGHLLLRAIDPPVAQELLIDARTHARRPRRRVTAAGSTAKQPRRPRITASTSAPTCN